MKKFFLILITIIISQNVLAQWVQLNIPAIDYIALAVAPNGAGGENIFAATAGNGIRLSTNLGETWTTVNGSNGVLDYGIINTIGVSPNGTGGATIFAGLGGLGVFRSTNNGTDWAFSGIGNREVISFAKSPIGGDLFAGTRSDGIHHSTNDGLSWVKIGISGLNINAVYSITVTSSTGGLNVYAGTWLEGLFLLTNNFGFWTETNLGFMNDCVQMLTKIPNGTGGTNLYAGTNTGLYVSTNGGSNWSPSLVDINSGVSSLVFSGTNYFASTSEGVYVSTNSGQSWNAANDGLTNLNVSSLAIAGSYLFASTVGEVGPVSIWRRPLSELTSIDLISDIQPSEFRLEQNYPNPFNPSTTISWQSPVGSWQSLKVYDILGREVATLVDDYREAGYHTIEFDASYLSSGVYYYQLKINEYVSVKKMMLMK